FFWTPACAGVTKTELIRASLILIGNLSRTKMSSADCVKIHKENGVMTITLNRPEAGNAIDLAMAQALMPASIVADQDSSVRCVLLTASERFFCVGGDVGAFAQSIDQLPSLLTELTSYLNPVVSRLLRMNKPLVVAVNGAAA